METRLLELFLAVADHGSFAAAARAEGVDPSAVSRAVAALETHLDARLFERTTRRVALTVAGERYLAVVRPALDILSEAEETVRNSRGALSGPLRITASVAYGATVLMPRLAAFAQRHPKVLLSIDLTDRRVDLLAERVDLAVRLGPAIDSSHVGRRLHAVRHRVCAAPKWIADHGTPATPVDLADHPAVCFDLPGFRNRWRFREPDGTETRVAITPRLLCTSAPGVLAAAREGLGPALVSDWSAAESLAGGTLVDLFPEHEVTATDFEAAAWLLWPSRTALPTRTRALVDWLGETVR